MENKERGYTITRVFDAAPQRVWWALTEPKQFAQWFGLPDSSLSDVRLDVRVGGAWQATMHLPDGKQIPWSGKYLEVDEPRKLVMAFSDQMFPGGEYEMFT